MNKRIIYETDDGLVAVIVPDQNSGLTIEQIAEKDVPAGKDYEIVDGGIPSDRTFRGAWVKNKKIINVDLFKAKEIAHAIRREKRGEEFKPLDIEATIPDKSTEAEIKRQIVRDKYDALQVDINSAKNVNKLKEIIESIKSK